MRREPPSPATCGSRKYSRERLHQRTRHHRGRRIHECMRRPRLVVRTLESRQYRRSTTPAGRPPAGVELSVPHKASPVSLT
jgi:hypothetical protein